MELIFFLLKHCHCPVTGFRVQPVMRLQPAVSTLSQNYVSCHSVMGIDGLNVRHWPVVQVLGLALTESVVHFSACLFYSLLLTKSELHECQKCLVKIACEAAGPSTPCHWK